MTLFHVSRQDRHASCLSPRGLSAMHLAEAKIPVEKIIPVPARIATKIVCTIGPASGSPTVQGHMIRAGMDVARINFSHGNYEEHLRNIKSIRKVSHSLRRPVAILQDLPGPKLRVGRLVAEPMRLRRLESVTLTTKPSKAKGKIPVAYPDLPKTVRKGDTIYLADGSVRLEVLRTTRDEVEARVLVGGDLISGKGLNLPKLRARVPAITREDREHLHFGFENNVDMVAVSFVQRADDIRMARKVGSEKGRELFVVAKIEKKEAVENLEEIVKEAERYLPKQITQQRREWHENSQEDAIAFAACETALQISAAAIVTPTRTGKTARRVSKYRPPLPIVALTSQAEVEKQLLLSWGVQTERREMESTESIFTEAEKTVKRLKLARKGNTIVIVSGDPKGPMGRTDLLKIQRVR